MGLALLAGEGVHIMGGAAACARFQLLLPNVTVCVSQSQGDSVRGRSGEMADEGWSAYLLQREPVGRG